MTPPVTGAWIPVTATSNGVKVDIGDSVTITGLSINLTPNDGITIWKTGAASPTEIMSGPLGGTGIFSGIAFNSNSSRQEVFIQNISTVNPTYIRYGQPASTQAFNVCLNPASTSGFAGGSFTNERFRGQIYFSGGAITAYEI
jgi:hypothetical protein